MPNSYNPAKDPYASTAQGIDAPATLAAVITPSDAADLPVYCKALRVFVPGSLDLATVRVTPTDADDDANTLSLSFPPGLSYEPLAVRKVWLTGTTSSIEILGYTV
ncbi:MAG: hypothetical protein CFE31_09940 [Rhizobiales bacterium PAR1]|nr:MAG: hypothetical protein CFE31_09940 [Rhizobiales bacterium PAR1]